ncbi:MAG TPA: hypothetical protein DEQ98_00545 [Acidobacteria bacterium]|nr:hypothetical protein [Acidobacteriota bacterium]
MTVSGSSRVARTAAGIAASTATPTKIAGASVNVYPSSEILCAHGGRTSAALIRVVTLESNGGGIARVT